MKNRSKIIQACMDSQRLAQSAAALRRSAEVVRVMCERQWLQDEGISRVVVQLADPAKHPIACGEERVVGPDVEGMILSEEEDRAS